MRPFFLLFFPTLLLLLAIATDADAQIAVTSSLVDDREVAAGTSYDGAITVRNSSSTERRARVYQTDLTTPSPGRESYPAAGSTPRSSAGWVSYGSPTLTLAPGAPGTIPFTVTVPSDTSPGTYLSMVMVEGLEPETNSPGSGVRQVLRYGVQLVTHVAGNASADIRFADVSLMTEDAGAVTLQVDIENVGERMGRPDCRVELFDQDGAPQGRLEGCGKRLFPGAFARARFDLSHLERGTYTSVVVIDSGGDEVLGTQYTLEL